MIPIKDLNPRHKFPYVTVSLIVLNVLVFLYELSLQASGGLNEFIGQWGVVPYQLVGSFSAETPTLFTSMFLHGGWSHLGGNMLYLWIFGDNVEDRLGPVKFLIFYIVTGLAASFAQVAIDPSSTIPTVGASGAIAGVLGGYLILFPHVQVLTIIPVMYYRRMTRVPAYLVLGFWFVLQLFNGVMGQLGASSNVAFFAHVGGFVAGMLLVLALGGRKRQNYRNDPYQY